MIDFSFFYWETGIEKLVENENFSILLIIL